jgi:hypothetical protein
MEAYTKGKRNGVMGFLTPKWTLMDAKKKRNGVEFGLCGTNGRSVVIDPFRSMRTFEGLTVTVLHLVSLLRTRQ